MRIIAGEYGGRVIKSPHGLKTRPTSDRLRETLFNILNPLIDHETRFLDLCAGTGAVGIEAISRGAGFVSFVDKSRRACALVEENLETLKIPEHQTEITCCSAEQFLRKEKDGKWTIIFYDPPYRNNYDVVISEIGGSDNNLVSENATVIVEHHFKNELAETIGKLNRSRIVKQGETSLSIYKAF